MLALVIHVLVSQKHIGHLVTLLVFAIMVVTSQLAIGHDLLLPVSGPEWSYTDMSGFGSSLEPWLWFKMYWAAWALLLAVVTSLFWVRSTELSLRSRFRQARLRFTRAAAGAVAMSIGLILTLGGFIFYNTNVLNEYRSASDRMEQRAEYERRYEQYRRIPQPRLTGVNLQVEIYPAQRALSVRGTYYLVNSSAVAIDTIHLTTEAELRELDFDRPAQGALEDQELGHRVYHLQRPLNPGDSMQFSFSMLIQPRGFSNEGVDSPVAANGTYFTNHDWLPAIGYQPRRELNTAGERRAYRLAPRPTIPVAGRPPGSAGHDRRRADRLRSHRGHRR